jgi:hypothetical protein
MGTRKKRNKDIWDTSNSDCHVPYTDEDIELILHQLPIPSNCELLGKALKRSSGAIRQVFEKAYMPHSEAKNLTVGKNRVESSYNIQIQKISKKLRLIRGYNVFKYQGKKDSYEI